MANDFHSARISSLLGYFTLFLIVADVFGDDAPAEDRLIEMAVNIASFLFVLKGTALIISFGLALLGPIGVGIAVAGFAVLMSYLTTLAIDLLLTRTHFRMRKRINYA